MAGGASGSQVIGGQNLSTPLTGASANGLTGLGMPQTSQLSGLQSLWGGATGNGQAQMVPSQWQQVLQQLAQQHMQQNQSSQGSQGVKGGSLTSAAGGIMGLLGL